ncbi:hypothetical protein K523DRAFT_407425 [Schizophyllum commune Tattone D]|nr:hypothetical protein K523DRAFT_407425 [Schizophyllum commune Tattone D]
MATAASSSSGKKYGGIPNIPPGTTFPDRKALKASGVHAEVRAGIFAEKYRDGAYAVLLNGGYADQDHGELIEYVGQGGLDKPGGTQVSSQKWDWRNKSLQQSYESRKPVRVVRGFKLNSPYAPEQGFRYDGLYSVTKKLAQLARRLPAQSPLPPPRNPVKTAAHAHATAGGSGYPIANGNAQASSSPHARGELGELTGSSMDTREVQQAARDSEEDEVESADSEKDDSKPDDASDSSGMSVNEDEDECPHRRHGALSSALAERSRLRPMPRSSDDEEADEELEVQGILETPVDEGEESGSSAVEDDVESSEEDDGHEGSVVDALSQAASVKKLCAAMLEAAAMSEQASKSTRTRVVPRDASEANETSTSTGASPEPQSSSSSLTPEADDLIIAMAELKESTALFDAAMKRLRDAERTASHPGASSLAAASTRSTTESDFEDTLGDAAAAAASAADLASLAIRRRA